MTEEKGSFRDTLFYGAGWVLLSAIAILDLLAFREALLDVLTLIQKNILERRGSDVRIDLGFAIQTVDYAMLFIGGVATVAIVVWIEYYLRQGQKKGLFFRRFLRILGVEAAIFVLMLILVVLI